MSTRRQREKKKNRNERRKENDKERKKKTTCKLGVSGRTSDFNIYRGNLILYVLVLHFETRNFDLCVQLQEYFW